MDWFTDLFAQAQQALFEGVVQPVVFGLGFGNLLEDAFDATGWLLVGLLQIVVMLAVIGTLQRWRPAEAVTDRHAIRIDIAYTLIQRLGLFRLVMFFSLDPLFDAFSGQLRMWGLPTLQLDALWPGVTDLPWVSFALYLLAFDLLNYWLHRAQHQFNWWWALHSLHHSQRQMTMWSDSRNHLLDDVLMDCRGAAGQADRRGTGPVRGAGGHHPAAGEPAACQPAHHLRLAGRAAGGEPALPPAAPFHRHRP